MAPRSATAARPAVSNTDSAPKNFKGLWDKAQERYKAKSGRSLPSIGIFASKTLDPDEVIQYINERGQAFDTFRTNGEKIRKVLKPMVNAMLPFLDAGAEGAADVAPGGKAVSVAVGVLLNATKGVSGLYDVIEALLQRFNTYLERIKIHLEPSAPPTSALMDIFADTLVQILITLAIVTKHCDAVKGDRSFKDAIRASVRRTKDFVRVIMDKNDVKEALNKFEELTKHELLATAAHTNAIVRKIYDETVLNSLRSWLRAPDPYDTYTKKRQADSCQWFFDDRFRDWKSRKDGMYWVYGRAGSGKSVLCSSVIDTLHVDTSLLLAYFYFDYKTPGQQDCRALVSSLVFQIGTSFDEGMRSLEDERRRSPHPPVYEKLLNHLSRLLGLAGRTCIVIDALDECPESLRDTQLLSFLERLSDIQHGEDVNLRVLVVSRPESDIRDHMPGLATHILDFGEASQHMEEITDYISNQLYSPDSTSYAGWSTELKERVHHVLTRNSNGIFLWVKLQLRILKRCTTKKEVERALYELPSGLYETYERILGDFEASKSVIDCARRVFECVAFAEVSLSPEEVVEILSTDFDSPADLPMDLNSRIDFGDADAFIVRQTTGLLEVVAGDKGHKTVQFIHLSVKEYLTSDKLKVTTSDSPAHLYKFKEDDAHITLARICLSALVDVDNSHSQLEQYADQYWHAHVSDRNDDAIGELLYRFLHLGSASFARWSRLDLGVWEYEYGGALHCAAYFELCHHTKRILERSVSACDTPASIIARERNAKGETALHIAAVWGHVNVVRLLLDHGALIDDTNGEGEIPLHVAAARRQLDTVRFLLSHPAIDGSSTATVQCSARTRNGRSALHSAAGGEWHSLDYADICRVLIEQRCLVDDVDNDGNTPLHLAAASGNSNCVRLLDHPAADGSSAAATRCRVRNNLGQAPLHSAANGWDDLETCRILLECGAVVDDIDNNGDTPLHGAAAVGHLNIVRLLLEHPAANGSNIATLRCRARNQRGRTALHNAADHGWVDVCRVLLEHGEAVGDTDDDGNTALSLAQGDKAGYNKYCYREQANWEEVIELLKQASGEGQGRHDADARVEI